MAYATSITLFVLLILFQYVPTAQQWLSQKRYLLFVVCTSLVLFSFITALRIHANRPFFNPFQLIAKIFPNLLF